jgi:GNAT superfamily N-acetyltransferase
MNESYTLTLEESPDAQDVHFVRERLNEYNFAIVGDDHHKPLVIFVRDDDNIIVAGLLGGTYWGWLHVDILWVKDSLRRQGYGKALLVAAEQEAFRRDCRHAHLDMMSFQALEFYKRQGYTVFGELHDLPVGHTRYFMKKALLVDLYG